MNYIRKTHKIQIYLHRKHYALIKLRSTTLLPNIYWSHLYYVLLTPSNLMTPGNKLTSGRSPAAQFNSVKVSSKSKKTNALLKNHCGTIIAGIFTAHNSHRKINRTHFTTWKNISNFGSIMLGYVRLD